MPAAAPIATQTEATRGHILSHDTREYSSRSILLAFTASLCACWIVWVVCFTLSRYVFHLGYPYDHLTPPDYHLYDLLCFTDRFRHLHSAEFFSSSLGTTFEYPAPAAFMYALLYATERDPYNAFVVLGLALLLTSCFFLVGRLRKASFAIPKPGLFLAVAVILSYPLLFDLVQANIELFLFFICAAGIFFYLRGSFYLAALCFGFAASIKLYPFIFLALLLSTKKWKAALVGGFTIAASTLLGLRFIEPDIASAASGVRAGLAENQMNVIRAFVKRDSGFDHSIFGLIKTLSNLISGWLTFPPSFLYVYLAAAATLGVVLWWFRIRKLPAFNQVTCLTICVVLLPPTSYDYTLLHMYVPFALLLLFLGRSAFLPRSILTMTVLFGILFAPLNEFILKGVCIAGPIKCLVLSAMLYLALVHRWDQAASSRSEQHPLHPATVSSGHRRIIQTHQLKER